MIEIIVGLILLDILLSSVSWPKRKTSLSSGNEERTWLVFGNWDDWGDWGDWADWADWGPT